MKISDLRTQDQVDKYIIGISYTGESLKDAKARIMAKKTKFGRSLVRRKLKINE